MTLSKLTDTNNNINPAILKTVDELISRTEPAKEYLNLNPDHERPALMTFIHCPKSWGKIGHAIEANQFVDEANQLIFRLLKHYWKQYNEVPEKDKLIMLVEDALPESKAELLYAYTGVVESLYMGSPPNYSSHEFMIDSLTNFHKESSFYMMVSKMLDLKKRGNTHAALKYVTEESNRINNFSVEEPADPLVWGDEIKNLADNENIKFIVDDLIETKSLNLISGRSLGGKTVLVANAVGAILEGGKFLGHRCHQAAVLYLNCDRNRFANLYRRIAGSMDSPSRDEIIKNRLVMIRSDSMPTTLTAAHLKAWTESMRARLGDLPILIVVDTFRSAFMGEAEQGVENDTAILKYVKPIKDWVDGTNHSVWILHHNNKHLDDFSGSTAFLMLLNTKMNYQRTLEEPTGDLSVTTRNDFFVKYQVALDGDKRPYRIMADTLKAEAEDKIAAFIINAYSEDDQVITLKELQDIKPDEIAYNKLISVHKQMRLSGQLVKHENHAGFRLNKKNNV